MNCVVCGRSVIPPRRVVNKQVCSPECSRLRRIRRDREIYSPQRVSRNKLLATPAKVFKMKESTDLPPPSRGERERMMDGLHRLFLTTGDEVSLLFGQAQGLGRGIRYKGTEARI